MSAAEVRQIRVTHHGPADATVSIVVGASQHALVPHGNIHYGEVKIYDLRYAPGVNDHNVFTARVTIPTTGAFANDYTRLKFDADAKVGAIYIIVGTADSPVIAYQGYEDIPDP